MTINKWSNKEECKLADYLAYRVCSRAAGRLDSECVYNFPRDVYFVGNLRPISGDDSEPDGSTMSTGMRELLNKLSPVAFGAEFQINPTNEQVEVEVSLRWACYYRVFPTFSQQREYQNVQKGDITKQAEKTQNVDAAFESDEKEEEAIDRQPSPEAALTPADRQLDRRAKDTLCIRFRKISCKAIGNVLLKHVNNNRWATYTTELEQALQNEMRRASKLAASDPERVRTDGSTEDQIRVPASALQSEQSYSAFLTTLSSDIKSEWSWRVQVEVHHEGTHGVNNPSVLFEFANATPMPEQSINTEAYIFDNEADFSFGNCEVIPFELEQAPRGFRYDRNLWGRGFNCAVVQTSPQVDSHNSFSTTNTPTYRQMRFNTQTKPIARFEDLAANPVPILEKIEYAMKEYLQEWERWRARYHEKDFKWESKFGGEFNADLGRFESEISRFHQGLDLIKNNADVNLAFKLTNETFHRGPHTQWRLFQVVFITMQIPGIVALANPQDPFISEREYVDVVYFPTGGGKTEAYLGVTVFHCFFDRLRGKTAGVTTWARFPLRLLTVQQMQRFADAVGMAELVRREQQDPRISGKDVDGFAVGYFVGKEARPNEISPPRANEPDATWSKALDPVARQDWKKIMKCPCCGTASVIVDFDSSAVRLSHRCTNPKCKFPQGIIPVLIVDNEIYRYLPSVMVGTIDKLAAIGNQRKLSLVFGQVNGRCSKHGYFNGKCCQPECTDKSLLNRIQPRGVSGPTLFVQDELHLLREGLGTFDAHYETFTQVLLHSYGQPPLKIIASSATIEAFERQVEHLYGRSRDKARIFPALGPSLQGSFYAETLDFPQRIYVGLIPHNKTIFNTILEVIQYYHEEVQELQKLQLSASNPFGGQVIPGSKSWIELLDYYATSLTYFLAGRELNSIRTDLDSHTNTELQRHGYKTLELPELTGSTGTDEVTHILDRLQTPSYPESSCDAVLATSMVSHGVDIDRLNTMIFYGMPRQNAEYIQASSRVGRAHTGVVFTCFHPARERDQSHYAYFGKFHEYLGQLIEPVAINRWSKFSVQRTLPGLFMAVLLQLLANQSHESNPNRFYMVDFVKKQISQGKIRAEDFIPILQQAYNLMDSKSPIAMAFAQEIRGLVNLFLDQVVAAGSQTTFVSEALTPRPMNSLREVDELLEIELDDAGTKWSIRAGYPTEVEHD